MKKLIVFTAFLPALACTYAFLSGRFPLSIVHVAAAFTGSVFAGGLILFGLSDDTRKPRFRVRRATAQSAAAQPHVTNDSDLLWTYTTRSS